MKLSFKGTTMKTFIKICTLLMVSAIMFSCSDQDPLRTGLEGKTLPDFSILLRDSNTVVNTGSMKNKNPIVILYFSPYCPYCKDQIENIVENIKSLDNIQFLFVSGYSINEIQKVYNKYNLSKYNNITVGRDTGLNMARYFGSYSVPYLAIYDTNKKLKHAFLGKLNVGQIKKVAESN